MDELAECSIEKLEGVTVVTVTGEIDLSNVEELRLSIQAAADEAPVILDISALSYIDSTGLQLLCTLAGGGGLRVVAGEGTPSRKLIELTSLDTVILVDDSLQSALASTDPGSVRATS